MKRPATRIPASSCAPRGKTRSCIVGKMGVWKTVTHKNKTKEQRWERRELQGPVSKRTYSKRLKTGVTTHVETNVRYIRRTWRNALGDKGDGVECEGVEIAPWVEVRRGRPDLRVDLTGVAKKVYWHDALWFFFHNNGRFRCWAHFARALNNPRGHRVDHVGANPATVLLEKLRLHSARSSSQQGATSRKRYRSEGTQYWTQRRLCEHA